MALGPVDILNFPNKERRCSRRESNSEEKETDGGLCGHNFILARLENFYSLLQRLLFVQTIEHIVTSIILMRSHIAWNFYILKNGRLLVFLNLKI